jgi:hypothetical protein
MGGKGSHGRSLNKSSLAKAENAIRPAPCIAVSIGGESEAGAFAPRAACIRAEPAWGATERAAINHHARGKTFNSISSCVQGGKKVKKNKSSCACIVVLMTKL